LSEDGGFCRSRTFDTSSSGCCTDELNVRSFLRMFHGVKEANTAGSTKTSEKVCHGFRITKQVTFYHLLSKHHFWAAGAIGNIA
jgi:hypothetical protein